MKFILPIINSECFHEIFFFKKLTLDLAELRKEKEDLLKKVESSSDITSLAEEVSRIMAPQIQVTTLGPSRSTDLEIKQLQCKLKVSIQYDRFKTSSKSLHT